MRWVTALRGARMGHKAREKPSEPCVGNLRQRAVLRLHAALPEAASCVS
jgi:hypothetical protein